MGDMVIHFGVDDCHRIQVLRQAGFEVAATLSTDVLAMVLAKAGRIAAVVVSEDYGDTSDAIAEMVRPHTKAPIILFRRTQRVLDEKKFDRVYHWLTPPGVWVPRVAKLIARGRETSATCGSVGIRRAPLEEMDCE